MAWHRSDRHCALGPRRKRFGASVRLLLRRLFRSALKTYASSYHATAKAELDYPEAFADFCRALLRHGYRAFKIHGWHEGDPREEARNVLHVAKVVGDRMTLMLDPANELRTFADALYVGRACDEGGYFWYEDPLRDCGVSAFAHKKLREMLKTPILQTEYPRLRDQSDFLIAGGTDMLPPIPSTISASRA